MSGGKSPNTSEKGHRLVPALRRYGVSGKIALRNLTAYPAEFFSPVLTYSIFVFVFGRLYAAAVPAGGDLAGYSQRDLVYYFAVAELGVFGLGRLFSTLSEEVKSGQVAYALTRPFDLIRYQCSIMLGPAFAQTAMLAVAGFGLAALSAGLPAGIDPLQAAALVVSLVLAGVLNFLLQTSLALTAFWFEENQAFFWIYQKFGLIIGTLMPLEFLPDSLSRLAILTPFAYIGYAPARIAVKFDGAESLRLLAGQALWILAAAVLVRLVFAIGRRKIAANGG